MNKEHIIELFNKLRNSISRDNTNRYIKNHFPEEYKFIMNNTSFLNKFDDKTNKNNKISIFERLYCIQHDLTDRPKCRKCGEEYVCGFNKQLNEYRKWCSPKCQASDKSCIDKVKNTKNKNYGSPTYNGIDKSRKTRFEKYGSFHSSDFVDKLKNTKLKRYGNENYVNVDKAKETKLKTYGDSSYNNMGKNKITKELRYGDSYYNNREKFHKTISEFDEDKKNKIKEKRLKTNINRYGVDYPMQTDDFINAVKSTNLKKYGVSSVLKLKSTRGKATILTKERSWEFIMSNSEYSPMFSKDEYISNRDCMKEWSWKHKCGNIFKSTYDDGKHCRCPICYPNNKLGISKMEIEIYEYIRSITNKQVYNHTKENKNVIKSGELDIWIPSLKLAVEFDGLYYHSESNGKDRTYHLGKTEECEKLGIQLIHIFEDEYVNKRKIVLSRLKNIICNNKRRIFARKCTIGLITPQEKDKFLEKYHIQGRDISKVNLGLYYKTRLVAVMTFIKSRFNKNYEYELSRYCTLSNFTIVGGASKLLRYFETNYNPKSIITFADRRWSIGNLYYKLGFTLKNISKPNYFYVKRGKRYSRLQFQKHMLKDKLENYNPEITEYQNMLNSGYDRIFDCGNYVFIKEYFLSDNK